MGKSTKMQRLREKMCAEIKHSRQSTLSNSPETRKADPAKACSPEQKKQIEIIEICTSAQKDELVLKVGFRLLPSKTTFSRLTSDLYFDGQRIESLSLRILQGPLATDEAEFSSVLDMTGISEGRHILKVEMYELWSEEKLTCASKEESVDYVPLRREDRLVRVPIVKSVAGADLAIVSDGEKRLYREMEEETKKEVVSKRDEW